MSILRSVPMVHFRVQVQSRDAPAVTRAIASEGLLHLVDIAHGRAGTGPALEVNELYAAFRDLRSRVRAVAERLEISLEEPEGSISIDENDFAAERERVTVSLEPIEKRVDQTSRALAAAKERSAAARELLGHAERLGDAGIDVRRINGVRFATIRFALGTEQAAETLATLLAPAPFFIAPLDSGDPPLLAIAVANFAKPRLEEALRVSLLQPVRLPAEPIDAERVRRQYDEAQKAESAATDDLKGLRQEIARTVASLAQKVEVATLLLQAQTYFAAAGRFIVISGWLPAESAVKMQERIRAVTEGRAVIDVERAEDVPGVLEGSIHVPILHRNPILLRPFQKLVEIYGTPSYGEVQPTAFFAVSFLLMFGLMFGDVGHGLVLFSAGWCLFRFFTQYLDYGILLMEAGGASAVFGLLYGSVFGFHGVVPTLWMEPLADLHRFMIVAIAAGALAVTSGLVINVINAWRSGNIREALYGPRGLMGAMLYWIALVIIARLFVPATLQVPAVVIIVMTAAALVVLIAAKPFTRRFEKRRPAPAVETAPRWLILLESAIELVDTLFSYFANTISFVRIAAFAAVHAGVFIAIFTIADTLARMPMGGMLSVIVHVGGNALVILLEGLTVSVQVLRLEYYEFFGKFFRGGGEPYVPLMLRRLQTAEEGRRKHA
ncbi:MAG TPA: V-type ATPase 116kDa subunit family protein [Thermoanaerobaculia bacterium]|nr:V-type ATPase 116kDa subunit family protein [Thermoanaerobaculia bacterium]